jgi:hypothetical protein
MFGARGKHQQCLDFGTELAVIAIQYPGSNAFAERRTAGFARHDERDFTLRQKGLDRLERTLLADSLTAFDRDERAAGHQFRSRCRCRYRATAELCSSSVAENT